MASGRRRGTPARAGFSGGGDRPALLLVAAWIVFRLYPYVPALNLGKYWHAIRPVLLDPLPHGSDPFRLCLMWLLCCMLVEAVAGTTRAVRLFPILAAGIFVARVLIADTALSSADIAGACIAYVLWLLFFRRAPGRHAILAAFFAAMLAAQQLHPSRGLDWIILVEKSFLYGGLIWLLNRAGLRLAFATLATAVLVLITGLAATHVHLRAVEITDVGLALCVGGAFHATGFRIPRRSTP